MTYVFAQWSEFDTALQGIYPDDGRTYHPIFAQFGVDFEQWIRLGGTESHFVFREVITVGGLDQNIAIPSLSILVGHRINIGLDFGLGPNFALTSINGLPALSVSVVYSTGLTFSFNDVYVPVNLAFVPTPSDSHPRPSLLTRFNFSIGGD